MSYQFNLECIKKRKREFVSRFTNERNPDYKELGWRYGIGEFSVHTDIAFDKYLQKQRKEKECNEQVR